ncbi:MAG: S41 family peptidase [Candidatus Levyibacteriota bacterium]|jgi:carboxyl-terminal processing protease
MKNRTLQVMIVILIAFCVGYFFGVTRINLDWQNFKPVINVASKEPPPGVVSIDFNPFWTVWQSLETNYYDKSKLDQQKMLDGAITGMVGALGDPFTIYLPPVQNNDFKQGLAGQFSGIGAELGTKDKDIIVIAPLDGSPAEKDGIKAGDIILKVDGQSVVGADLSKVVTEIRGAKGTPVTLTVQHASGKQVDIRIIRDIITVKSVAMNIETANCDQNGCKNVSKDTCSGSGCTEFAYIRLSQFGDSTNQDWANLVKGISSKINQDKNIKGVVLDLRNNPGGYLSDAQFIASEFLPQGNVVVNCVPTCSDNNGVSQNQLTAQRQDQQQGLLIDPKIKVVVLINKGSASASEIVSGALRDNKRAILVGETSYGKGTVQQAQDLGGGAGLHVTVAKWLTPNGTWVNGKGLTPDVPVSLDPKNPAEDTQLEKAVFELLE